MTSTPPPTNIVVTPPPAPTSTGNILVTPTPAPTSISVKEVQRTTPPTTKNPTKPSSYDYGYNAEGDSFKPKSSYSSVSSAEQGVSLISWAALALVAAAVVGLAAAFIVHKKVSAWLESKRRNEVFVCSTTNTVK